MKTNKAIIEALESRIAPAFSGTINLALLSGSAGAQPGFRLDGSLDGDNAGFSVADAGDVNGDGFSDLIIGAPDVEVNGVTRGAAYVVFGDDAGFPATVALDQLNGSDGFRIQNDIFSGARFGASVDGAGDVNGDGFDDVVIGAPLASVNGNGGAGISYVVFGKSSPFNANVSLNSINGQTGFALVGSSQTDFSGGTVSSAGDINGDGYGDIAIGAIGYDAATPGGGVNSGAGAAYVVYGHNGSFNNFTFLDTLSTSGSENGFRLEGTAANSSTGTAIASAGDFNGDGFGDLLVGASNSDAPGTSGAGRTYVVYGKAQKFATSLSLSSITGSAGTQIVGAQADDGFGRSVGGAGDINGDGYADIVVGATGSDPNGSNSGEAYVVYGRPGTVSGTLNAANANLRIQGSGLNDFAGTSVSGAGDFNGDGFSDLIVGVPGTNSVPGASYLVFGRPDGFNSPLNVNTLDGTAGFRINGLNIADSQGFSVSNAGDVNGDGFDDIFVGAPEASHGVTNAGEGYVLYGSNGGNQVAIGVDGKSATYTDADGDLVTIKVNKGTLEASDFQLSGANYLGGATLQKIDFNGDSDLEGANLKITAVPQTINGVTQGDGLANVGFLDASGVTLNKVNVAGDVGKINAGGAKTLAFNSFGALGTSTQAGMDANLISLVGGAPNLAVKTDIADITYVGAKVGKVKVGGDIENSKFFLSGGVDPLTAKDAVTLKKLSVSGNLDNSSILAGYSAFGGSPDVSIGKVAVGGDWMASTIVAGVSAGNDGVLGTADDKLFDGGATNIVSRIASVLIKGNATGSADAGGRFTISAEQVGSVTIGKTKVALDPLASDKLVALASTGDFFINEV